MINKKINEFVQCIEENRFYDAHESLEEIWFPRRFEKCSEIELLKGFINAAVSFELIKLGRIKQSKRVWKNYLKYRPNLYKITSRHKNDYYQLSRYIEDKQYQLLKSTIVV